MDAGDLRTVEMLIAEQVRYLRAEMDAGFALLRSELSPVADAAAVALESIIESGPESVEDGTTDDDDSASDVGEADAEQLDDTELGGAVILGDDGEIMMETAEVEALTPQEALDAIAPTRTHPWLRRIDGGFFGLGR